MKKIILAVMMAIMLAGCGLMTGVLEDQVCADLKEQLPAGCTVKDFTLIHSGGSSYRGIAVVDNGWTEEKMAVSVTYDGVNYMWEVE